MGRDLNDAQAALLVRAKHAGAVRDDVEVSDLKALINGTLAMQRHSAAPERMLEIMCDGLRPQPES